MIDGTEASEGIEMPEISKNIEGKKFMWDGYINKSESEAMKVESGYRENDFETRILQEENTFLVYTRRVVTDVVVEGEAPL